jgi:hypothetical protein
MNNIRTGAAVVHDDDEPLRRKISPEWEELPAIPPRDECIRELILAIAIENPHWGRLTIHEELFRLGHDIDVRVVNYVWKHDLPAVRRRRHRTERTWPEGPNRAEGRDGRG